MKTLTMYILVIVVVSTQINHQVTAQSFNTVEVVTIDTQPVDCSKAALAKIERKTNLISEHDYPYLRDIECLKNGYLKKDQIKIKFRNISLINPTSFVLRGTGIRTSVHATYNQDGKLVRAELNKKDTVLPAAIREYIYNSYNGWTMTGNNMIVRDFDTRKTEFTVNMQNGSEEKVLLFKNNGHQFVHLAGL